MPAIMIRPWNGKNFGDGSANSGKVDSNFFTRKRVAEYSEQLLYSQPAQRAPNP